MKQSLLWLAAVLCGCASAGTSGGASSGAANPRIGPEPSKADESAVVQAVEHLFAAMRTRDTAALRALIIPEAPVVGVDHRADTAQARVGTADSFIQLIAQPGDPLIERMWDPVVEVDGDLATLWAPYDFYRGQTFSHCGHDAVQLIRQNGTWRIAALSFTRRAGSDCGK